MTALVMLKKPDSLKKRFGPDFMQFLQREKYKQPAPCKVSHLSIVDFVLAVFLIAPKPDNKFVWCCIV